jgi:hypothetical protein
MPKAKQQPPPASAPIQPTGNRPVSEIKHRRIRAAIWQNQTERGTMYSVTVMRMYKDKDGKWHDTHSLNFDDLLTAAKALAEAHTMISKAMNQEREEARQSSTR